MQPNQNNPLCPQEQMERIKGFRQRQNYGPFIPKLYRIVQEYHETGVIPRPEKNGFTIVDEDKFKNITLPKNYPNSKMKYFLNQLDDYHFHQTDDKSPHRSFWAEHFNLDKPDTKIKSRTRLRRQKEDIRYRRHLEITNKGRERIKYLGEDASGQSENMMMEQYDYLPSNPESSIVSQGPFDLIQDESISKLVKSLGNLQAEQQMLEAEVQYLKDSRTKQNINTEEILKSDKSTNFKFHYFQKMQQYKLRQLNMLISYVNVSQKKKIPFEEYLDAYRHIHPYSTIDYRKVTKQTKERYWDCQFTQNALQLEHSGNKIDFDQFFKFDWKDFEILRFQDCHIKTVDWLKFCNLAKQNLPNLKQIYFGGNFIQLVKRSDFEKLNKIKKIELSQNDLNPLCEAEIENFVKTNRSIIIERD